MKKLVAVIVAASLIIILLLGVKEIPQFGSEDNPANNIVMEHYIDKGMEETGAMNIVTGIILDYRAFDTLVEASVLFTSVMAVFIVLKKDNEE